jgi:hypothetical protein
MTFAGIEVRFRNLSCDVELVLGKSEPLGLVGHTIQLGLVSRWLEAPEHMMDGRTAVVHPTCTCSTQLILNGTPRPPAPRS